MLNKLTYYSITYCFILLFAMLSLATAEDANLFKLSDWKIYSSFSDIRKLTMDKKGNYIAASNGGIIIYPSNSADSTVYFNSQTGLLSLDIRALVYDETRDLILTGAFDGSLQIITPDKKIEAYFDIKNYGFVNPEITDIKLEGNTLYIAGAFGLTLFDVEKRIFTETVTKLSDLPRNTKVNNIYLSGDYIFLASELGLVYAHKSKLLANPNNWNKLPIYLDKEKSKATEKYKAVNLKKINEELFLIANDSLILKANFAMLDTFQIVNTYPSYQQFKNIYEVNGQAYFQDQFNIRTKENNILFEELPKNLAKLGILQYTHIIETQPKVKALIGFQSYGFGIYENDSLSLFNLATPNTSRFYYGDVDNRGRLWLASGSNTERAGRGMCILNPDGTWINLNTQSRKEITTNNMVSLTVLSDGRVISGTWGKGFVEITPHGEDFSFKYFDNSNSPITGFKGGNYCCIGESSTDRNGDVYLINPVAMNGVKVILKYKKDGTFDAYDLPGLNNNPEVVYLEVDNSNTVWFSYPGKLGLYYFNERSNKNGIVPTFGNNMLSTFITCIKLDQKGHLWVASDKGVNIILNPGAAISDNPKFSIRKVNLLNNINVNSIYVDAVNNKWISTNEGVFVFSPDASNLIAKYDVKNSPLKTNIINAVTSNKATGQMYILASDAIYTANSTSVQPAEEYEVSCYPQPFDPTKDEYMTIDGLGRENTIKILNAEGRYISTIKSSGGRAIWNGRNEAGQFVENGIYIIVASEAEDGKAGVGKFAVEKK